MKKKEKKAYGCIEDEYESYRLLDTAKTEDVFDKRYEKYVVAQKKTKVAIALFDDFAFLYYCLLSAFRIFDEKGGCAILNDNRLMQTRCMLSLSKQIA